MEEYGDVVRLRMSNWRSRLIGYEVSTYVTRNAMVDSGFPLARPELDALLPALRLDGAFISHGHEDHAGNAPLLAERGVALAIAATTLERVRAARPIPSYRRFTWGTPEPLTCAVVPFTHPVLRFLPAPGHAADHHAVWDPERGTLFASDLWLGVRVKVAHESEDPRLLVRTLRAFAGLAPSRMFDAHRGPVRDPVTALEAKADWTEATIAAIDARIAAGWDDRAIARQLLGREDWVAVVSHGEYARINLVRAVRRTAPRPSDR